LRSIACWKMLTESKIQTLKRTACELAVFCLSTDFDLETWRVQLDDQGLQIGKNQESSLKNRRKLAESTRGECKDL
jgi:hypothetical protein